MVTQKDIAQAAKVQQSTVSAALNDFYGSKRIPEEKRAYIKRLAREMGYKVDDMARGMKTGKTKVIGFLSWGSPDSEHTNKIANAMSAAAERHDYMIKLLNSAPENSKGREKCINVVNLCVKNRLSGLVVHGIRDIDILSFLKKDLDKNGIELALISNTADIEGCIHVSSCDNAGIKRAINHLYERGHRDIGIIALELTHVASQIFKTAYMQSLQKYQLPNPDLFSFFGNYGEIADYLQKLFSGKKRPSAIVCGGDNIAIFVHSFLAKEFNVKLPEDISITGYGDFKFGQLYYPPITTVYEPFREMGDRIVEKIVAKLENRNFGELKEYIDTKLIVRGSTAPPSTS